MSKNPIHRRDFLKLLGLTPFIIKGLPHLFGAEGAETEPLRWLHPPAGAETAPLGSTVAAGRSQDGQDLPNILILVLDAFSASNASLYGYPRQTTPNLERFAQQATVYHRHYAGGNFTSPGTASLLTGTYPWSHRVFQYLSSVSDAANLPDIFEPLAGTYRTFAYTHNPLAFVLLHQFRASIGELTPISKLCLANASSVDRLFSEDYPIALEGENLRFRNITYPSSSFLLSPLDALRRLYLHYSLNRAYRDRYPRGVSRFALEATPGFMYFTLEDAIDWLQQQLPEMPQPFLGYVHLFPPHSPYVTRQEFYNRFDDGWQPPGKPESFFTQGYSDQYLAEQRRLYDETIAYADAEVGRLLDTLRAGGILDRTYLILTSDHGEMFERGIEKHSTPTLYEPIAHVPLLVSAPGQTQRRDVNAPTSNVDLLPTLCNIAGVPIPAQSEGQALPGSDFDANPERTVFVVEAKENPRNAPLTKATIAMIQGDYKLIYTFGYQGHPDTFELYDLHTDPEELANLYNESDPVSLALRDQLLEKLAQVNQQ